MTTGIEYIDDFHRRVWEDGRVAEVNFLADGGFFTYKPLLDGKVHELYVDFKEKTKTTRIVPAADLDPDIANMLKSEKAELVTA